MVSNSVWQKQREGSLTGRSQSSFQEDQSFRKSFSTGNGHKRVIKGSTEERKIWKGEPEAGMRISKRGSLFENAWGFLELWEDFSCLACCWPIFLQDWTAGLFEENRSPLWAWPNVRWNFSEQYGVFYLSSSYSLGSTGLLQKQLMLWGVAVSSTGQSIFGFLLLGWHKM